MSLAGGDTGASTDRSPELILLRASRHALAQSFTEGLDRCDLMPPERVVVACSGGSDSIALLALVAAVWGRHSPSLENVAMVTIDHGLRAAARAECEHAVEVAHRLGIHKATVRRVTVPAVGNTLDAARTARRSALAIAAAEHGARTVLLAHQADDRAEGLLLALSRGAGIEAACNLLPARATEHGITLCRPLLGVRRSALRGLLSELGLRWMDDPSNETRSRGAMRNDPSIRDLVDRISASAGDFLDDAASLAALRETLAAQAVPEGVVCIDRAAFDAVPSPVRSLVLIRLVRHAGGTLARSVALRAIEVAAQDRHPRAYGAHGGVCLTIDSRHVRATGR